MNLEFVSCGTEKIVFSSPGMTPICHLVLHSSAMNENESDALSPQGSPMPSSGPVAGERSMVHKIFIGENGLRAGWRILIFVALVFAFSYATRWVRHHWFPRPPRDPSAPFEPVRETISRLIGFAMLVAAAL